MSSLHFLVLHHVSLLVTFVHFLSYDFCDPMDCSTSGLPVLHHLPEFAQTRVPWVSDAIQPSHPLSSPPPLALNLSQNQSFFPMSQRFTSGGPSIGASASALILPVNIQGWFSLGLTGLILLSNQFSFSTLY